MRVDLPLAVQFELRNAVEGALCLPGHTRKPVHCPPHPDALIIYLPQALDLHKHVAEKNSPMESQGPKDQLVFVNPLERVPRVLEHYVIPINVVVEVLHKEDRYILAQGSDSVAQIGVVVTGLTIRVIRVLAKKILRGWLFIQCDVEPLLAERRTIGFVQALMHRWKRPHRLHSRRRHRRTGLVTEEVLKEFLNSRVFFRHSIKHAATATVTAARGFGRLQRSTRGRPSAVKLPPIPGNKRSGQSRR
mmetsp:Transcript_27209/g.48486  ORF Transcript_27209/g.48486 Transcript_27209/m.48486 type:complete len:247 (+) Transcript_27209:425-1165(+)